MTAQQPHIIVIGGHNGAGKSTSAPALLKGTLGVNEFVNTDITQLSRNQFSCEAGRLLRKKPSQ